MTIPLAAPERGVVPAQPGRPVRTVGVEEELLLVDAQTLVPTPVAQALMGRAAAVAPGLELEVKREQIEVVGPPLSTLDGLRASIVAGRGAADAAARSVGARAVPLATAPVPCTPHLVSTPRYDQMQRHFGLTMDEQLTCGFHVHVAVDGAEEGVGVLDRIRPWLPVLLALSANSPFWQGRDTGFASYRYQAWGRWPTAGPYDPFGSAAAYRDGIRRLLDANVLLDPGMVYFDARLSDHAPTVEVRIADVCLDPEDAAALAVAVRSLVTVSAAAWAAGEEIDPVPTGLLRLASWRASRSGLDEDLVHPLTGHPCPASEAVSALLAHIDAGFADPAERTAVVAAFGEILHRGNGARRQRSAHEQGGSCADVVAAALRAMDAPGAATSEVDTTTS
ncbi:glutamate--cysteine ligase [Microbacterium timonense]|uniref:glutamate--cysteine ligase n=1 Tax=Microbacterium timonense TaxID=2086576 RepID=UPI000D10233D|nr:glutamate--cysteine ligase [Microbacterium timonense]